MEPPTPPRSQSLPLNPTEDSADDLVAKLSALQDDDREWTPKSWPSNRLIGPASSSSSSSSRHRHHRRHEHGASSTRDSRRPPLPTPGELRVGSGCRSLPISDQREKHRAKEDRAFWARKADREDLPYGVPGTKAYEANVLAAYHPSSGPVSEANVARLPEPEEWEEGRVKWGHWQMIVKPREKEAEDDDAALTTVDMKYEKGDPVRRRSETIDEEVGDLREGMDERGMGLWEEIIRDVRRKKPVHERPKGGLYVEVEGLRNPRARTKEVVDEREREKGEVALGDHIPPVNFSTLPVVAQTYLTGQRRTAAEIPKGGIEHVTYRQEMARREERERQWKACREEEEEGEEEEGEEEEEEEEEEERGNEPMTEDAAIRSYWRRAGEVAIKIRDESAGETGEGVRQWLAKAVEKVEERKKGRMWRLMKECDEMGGWVELSAGRKTPVRVTLAGQVEADGEDEDQSSTTPQQARSRSRPRRRSNSSTSSTVTAIYSPLAAANTPHNWTA